MNELAIIEKDGIQAVSARELYKGLEITDRFNRWFESLLKYGFTEDEDFCCVKTSTQQNQYGGIKEIDDYIISLDMAKQICMLQRSEQGKAYRNYLIRLEKAWNTPEAVMARALQLANKTLEEATKQVAIMQPKADYYDSFMDSSNLIEIGHLGKTTKVGEHKIFKRMVSDGYIKVRYSTDGVKYYDPCFGYEKYFKSIPKPYSNGDKTLNRDKLMLTSEGFVYFTKKYSQNFQKELLTECV